MMRRAPAAVLLLLAGCSNGGSSSGPAGLSRGASVSSLDTQQVAMLCDWINASVGGYGSIDNCVDGTSKHADSTPQSCIGGLGPYWSVGAVEDCVNALGGDLCKFDMLPVCAALDTCVGPDAGAD